VLRQKKPFVGDVAMCLAAIAARHDGGWEKGRASASVCRGCCRRVFLLLLEPLPMQPPPFQENFSLTVDIGLGGAG
jgi:hypothetical protein